MKEAEKGMAWGGRLIDEAARSLPPVSRLHRELNAFRNIHAPAAKELTTLWYSERAEDLAVVAAAHPGVKLCLNVSGFSKIDSLLKKLSLVSDLVLCRDIRPWGGPGMAMVPIPPDFSGLEPLPDVDPSQAPPILIRRPAGSLTLTSSQTSFGAFVAVGQLAMFPEGTFEWLESSGRSWLESGAAMFAPFYPDLEVETEFIRQGVYPSAGVGAIPIDPSSATGWQSDKVTAGVLRLNVPWLENASPELIQQFKADEGHAFLAFRNSLLTAIEQAQGAVGSNEFSRDLQRIQRDVLDEGVARLQELSKRLARLQSLRSAGVLVGTLATGISCMVGLPLTATIAASGASTIALVKHLIDKFEEQGKLRDDKAYFLWRLKQEAV